MKTNKNAVKSSVQDFSKSVSAQVPRSKFYRPSGLKTTFDAGKLVPVYIDEVLPGDTFNMKLQHVAKMITPLTPTMDNIELEFFAFFVPNRLVWDNWEELMGENNTDAWTPPSTPASVPVLEFEVQQENKVGDYYGIPIGLNPAYHPINALPFRGYNLIWNEWFRNQNIQAPRIVETGNTGDDDYLHNFDLIDVNKPFDYFTSCLPEPQKGESQLIPIELNELIPVITSSTESSMTGNQPALKLKTPFSGSTPARGLLATSPTGGTFGYTDNPNYVAEDYVDGLYPSNLFADPTALGDINSTTISDLRTAFQIQKLFERDARGGTRYVEILKAHFGVDARDYRLQRPEYLGHIKSLIGINQVAQTSQTETTPQGNLAAYAHSQGNDFFFNKSFVEHGFLHIFAVARQKKTYQQGLERFWSRQDRLDYYMPVLAHISEQPVYTKELYALANNPDTVFGYNEAWSDYRYKPSRTSGQMRSDNTNSLDIWHYADDYSAPPTLANAWMVDNSNKNLERTLAITGSIHPILADIRFDLTCIRPLPVNSIPGYIDHF